jgi:hypothetical protein
LRGDEIVSEATSSSESSIITLLFFTAGSVLPFVSVVMSLNECELYPRLSCFLSLLTQKWHRRSPRPLHPLQLPPLPKGRVLISTSSCSLATFAGGLYPAGVEKNFLHESVTIHKLTNMPSHE